MNVQDYITVSEFRKNTKVMLDAARAKPIILRRGDELFHIQKVANIFTGGANPLAATTPPVDIGVKSDIWAKPSIPAESQPIPKRTPSSVKRDIDAWELEMKDSIDPTIVQDAETLAKNRQEYYDTRQTLWAEYHQLKGTEGDNRE